MNCMCFPKGNSTCRRALRCGLVVLLCSCTAPEPPILFTRLSARQTGVSFSNTLKNEPGFNILDYLYFYDGGGVAIGDINNDELPDIFLTGNQEPNRLYLNEGDLTFRDISVSAGILHTENSWSTGVTMADVNADGWLDFYVCQVDHLTKRGHNLLYINGGDLTFSEESIAYGLAFEGLSTQAAFFDFDRDGDLDMYLLNHAYHTAESFVPAWRRSIDVARMGDRLYQNDNGFFVNVTSEAGIYSSLLGYGLGLAVSDFDQDGWPDIYVGNDFHENDYLYFNNGDGTFKEALQRVIGHTSQSTMGVDVADINNDGRVEVLSLDMLPPDLHTYRKSEGPDPENVARIKKDFGYAPQHSRNMLQYHRGYDADGYPVFSEIGIFAGIHATDWSWSGLIVDLDNDGWKDIFISNGIPGRPNDLDYLAYTSDPEVQRILHTGSIAEQLAVADRMPTVNIPNYGYKNDGRLRFADVSSDWGLSEASYSTGAAFGDLDADGDIDLVVNNINAPVWIYRNNTLNRHHLAIALEGLGGNTTGIGAKVHLYAAGRHLFQEQVPTRGFQSSVGHTLHFGLGMNAVVDSLVIQWPTGAIQTIFQPSADTLIRVAQGDAWQSIANGETRRKGWFVDVTTDSGLNYRHRENDYDDFARQPLLPHRLSTRGPAIAVGDVNADNLDDIFFGGSHGMQGELYIQVDKGTFRRYHVEAFADDEGHEDAAAVFFDADLDGDADLYVVSGGGELPEGTAGLEDRLYINSGGILKRSSQPLPRADGCCVAVADYDSDGDQDLFVGARSVPSRYGVAPPSFLLNNNGAGSFSDVTASVAPSLETLGMVTSATWADVTGGPEPDLVVAGEWTPITVLTWSGSSLSPVPLGLNNTAGWWQSVLAEDIDADGDVDLVVGNLGINSVLQATPDSPLSLYIGDFDNNGVVDPVMARVIDNEPFAWARYGQLLEQLPELRQLLPTSSNYADANIHKLFGDRLHSASHRNVYTFQTSMLENNERAAFEVTTLPGEIQWSSVAALLFGDVNYDGQEDIIAAGNFFGANTIQGRYDASIGSVLLGPDFTPAPLDSSGMVLRGQVRDLRWVHMGEGEYGILVARNNAAVQFLQLHTP